jgi:hypothetical protein
MNGWIRQKYVNVPACVKVCEATPAIRTLIRGRSASLRVLSPGPRRQRSTRSTAGQCLRRQQASSGRIRATAHHSTATKSEVSLGPGPRCATFGAHLSEPPRKEPIGR